MITSNIKIAETDSQLILIINRKPNWLILPFTGLWTLGWLGMFSTIIYGLATDTDKLDGGIILFMVFFFIAGLFVLKIFLWHARGREKIIVDDKELQIHKMGTILTIPRKYEINDIEYISNAEMPSTPRWIKFWGLGGGQIEFVYLGQAKYFGQTLTAGEATRIIEKIGNRIRATNCPTV